MRGLGAAELVLGSAARLLWAMAWLGLGCEARTFDLEPESTNGPRDGGSSMADLGFPIPTDATSPPDESDGPAPDGFPPTADGPDPVCTADLQKDPANCGRCGQICTFPNAEPACAAGACVLVGCLPGFQDLNRDPADGCEYACLATNNGQEVCDNRDNNCDGRTDETTDKQTDDANCGGCGNACVLLHASPRCQMGKCAIAACEAEWKNANGIDVDGCECQVTNGSVEVCDGIDNDCNGKLDDVPASSFESDVQNCGACRRNCTALPHAVGGCESSGCVIVACELGYRNVDRLADNGCEQACPGGFEGGVEVCDGVDNDCDGFIDADDADMVAPSNYCEQRGACAGSAPRCEGGQWVCTYGPDVETAGPNRIVPNETRCDGIDNDCDGCIDDPFVQVARGPTPVGGSCPQTPAQQCSDDGVGACQGQGKFMCKPDKTGVVCEILEPGSTPAPEVCDGLDNNCDGTVDNSGTTDPARIKDPMVAISGGGLSGTVYIFAYEASRPDAKATSPGAKASRACSKPGVMPWTNVTYPEAVAACQAAGKRLCTEAEWQRACQTASASACTWSFASACTVSSTQTCNTYEYDGDGTIPGDQDVLLSTAGRSGCYVSWGADKIYDLTGNAKEWTKARSAGQNPVRGGAFDNVLSGSTCTFDFAVFDDNFRFGNTGFRCCSDNP